MMTLAFGALSLLFLGFFWLTPWGVRRMTAYGHGEKQLDLRMFYSPTHARRLLQRYEEDGIAHFRRLLLVDMAFPAIYAIFLARLGLWATGHAGPAVTAMTVGPVVAAAFDYAENALLLRALAIWPQSGDRLIRLASACTTAKFLAALSSVTVLAWCGVTTVFAD
jgi:hypothetical protein